MPNQETINIKVNMSINIGELNKQINAIGHLIDTVDSLDDSNCLEGALSVLTTIKDEIPQDKKTGLTRMQRVILSSFLRDYPQHGTITQVFDDLRLDIDRHAQDKTIDIYFVFEDWDTEFLINHIQELISSAEKAAKDSN